MRSAVLLLAAGLVSSAQALPSATFEVVSVKRNRTGDPNASTRVRPGGGMLATNNTLRGLVRNVYRRESFQIVGGPSWIDSDRFDIVATGGSEDVPFDVVLARAKALLADRFRLVVHSETRKMPTYELSLARADGRLGPQLRRSAIDCRQGQTGRPGPTPSGRPGCPQRSSRCAASAGATGSSQPAGSIWRSSPWGCRGSSSGRWSIAPA